MTLKELIDSQKYTGVSDIDIIKFWFVSNDKESEGISLMAELSKAKMDKIEDTLGYARAWIPNIPLIYEANIGCKHPVSKDIAAKLDVIVLYHLLDMPLSDVLLNWAKENIPTMESPTIMFRPAIEWLKNEYGIEFVDREFKNKKG